MHRTTGLMWYFVRHFVRVTICTWINILSFPDFFVILITLFSTEEIYKLHSSLYATFRRSTRQFVNLHGSSSICTTVRRSTRQFVALHDSSSLYTTVRRSTRQFVALHDSSSLYTTVRRFYVEILFVPWQLARIEFVLKRLVATLISFQPHLGWLSCQYSNILDKLPSSSVVIVPPPSVTGEV